MIYYKQCRLQCGNMQQTSWLPEVKAKLNKKVLLGKDTKVWTITEVFSTRVEEDVIKERSDDYKHQRKASDI